jgi:hypothetical protein
MAPSEQEHKLALEVEETASICISSSHCTTVETTNMQTTIPLHTQHKNKKITHKKQASICTTIVIGNNNM